MKLIAKMIKLVRRGKDIFGLTVLAEIHLVFRHHSGVALSDEIPLSLALFIVCGRNISNDVTQTSYLLFDF